MKNFSDLLVTDSRIDVILQLSAITENGVPGCGVSINDDVLWHGPLPDSITLEKRVHLHQPIQIDVSMWDKTYHSDRETAVVLHSLQLDGFEIVPGWTHVAKYHNDHAWDGATSYLGFNGTWSLHIPVPFYRWLHEITGQGWLLAPIPGNHPRQS